MLISRNTSSSRASGIFSSSSDMAAWNQSIESIAGSLVSTEVPCSANGVPATPLRTPIPVVRSDSRISIEDLRCPVRPELRIGSCYWGHSCHAPHFRYSWRQSSVSGGCHRGGLRLGRPGIVRCPSNSVRRQTPSYVTAGVPTDTLLCDVRRGARAP